MNKPLISTPLGTVRRNRQALSVRLKNSDIVIGPIGNSPAPRVVPDSPVTSPHNNMNTGNQSLTKRHSTRVRKPVKRICIRLFEHITLVYTGHTLVLFVLCNQFTVLGLCVTFCLNFSCILCFIYPGKKEL